MLKSNRTTSVVLCLTLALVMLAACATPTPEIVEKVITQVVKETVVQKEMVKETVIVEGTPQVVEKEVTRIVEVEKEKVVTATPEPAPEQVLFVPLTRLGGSIDPSLSYGQGYEFLPNLFDGLTRVDYTSSKLVAAVAEKWDISEDATVFTFYLKDGLEWSDGTPVTAGDFEYSWLRTLDPETQSPTASDMYCIEGAEAYNKGESSDPESVGIRVVDDLTLEVTLAGPRPAFARDVSGVVYFPLPEWAINEYGSEGDEWMKPGHITTNGPYVIGELEPDQEVVLVRNENYKGDRPAIDKATWVLFEHYMAQSLLAFEAGDLDMAWVSGDDLERVQDDAKLGQLLQEYQIGATCFCTFDTTNPPFDDPRVRLAFSLAVNREQLNNIILKGTYDPAYTAVPPKVVGYTPDAAITGDVEEAKRLLAEAGYPNGEGLRVIAPHGSSGGEWRLLAEALQAMWQENLGVTIELNLMESKALSAYSKKLVEETLPYDIRIGRRITVLSSDPVNWYNNLFDPDNDWLRTRWGNEQFLDLIREGRYEQDLEKQAEIYQEAEKVLLEDMPVIPLYHTVARWVVQPYVTGLVFPAESAGQIIDLRPVSIQAH